MSSFRRLQHMTKTLHLPSGRAELVASRSLTIPRHVSSLKMLKISLKMTNSIIIITTSLITIILITIPITLIITLISQMRMRWPILSTPFPIRMASKGYSYWVDIYVEIDYGMCDYNGELDLCNAGTIGPNTINYGKPLSLHSHCIRALLITINHLFPY